MKIKDFPEIYKKVKIIRRFAKDMGYTTDSCYYYPYDSNRPAFAICLNEILDVEGNPYEWAWYMDTGEEII